jgi:hypothetical protein
MLTVAELSRKRVPEKVVTQDASSIPLPGSPQALHSACGLPGSGIEEASRRALKQDALVQSSIGTCRN